MAVSYQWGDGSAVLDLDPGKGDQGERGQTVLSLEEGVVVQVILLESFAESDEMDLVFSFDPEQMHPAGVSMAGLRRPGPCGGRQPGTNSVGKA